MLSLHLPLQFSATPILSVRKFPGTGPVPQAALAKTCSFVVAVVCSALLLLGLASPVQAGFSDAEIAEITQRMEGGFESCSAVDAAYQIDCYRRVYERASQDLKGQRLQADAQKAMRRTAVELKRLARAYADPTAPKIQVGGKTVTAIRPDALPQATAQARRILQETETYLLRGNRQAALHYQRIASVVNSSKVLLRSA